MPLYLSLVDDLRAVTNSRDLDVLYVLQPEIVLEDDSLLTETEREIQQFAFVHHREKGTLAWRHLAPRLAAVIDSASTEQFRFLDLTRIGHLSDAHLYTDYTHLTSEGNRVVAGAMLPVVMELLGLKDAEGMTAAHTSRPGAD